MELVMQWLSATLDREFILRRTITGEYFVALQSNTKRIAKYVSPEEIKYSRFDLLELTLRKAVFEICPSMKDDEPII